MPEVLQIFRDFVQPPGGDFIAISDFHRFFGTWEDGRQIGPHELVLFKLEDEDGQPVRLRLTSQEMEKLRNAASCFVNGGGPLGTIGDFDNPAFSPAEMSPIVWIDGPAPGGGFSWGRADCATAAQITAGSQVVIPDLNVRGRILAPIALRPYLSTKQVRACALEFDQNLANLEGAPVLLDSAPNTGRLVGMLFNLRASDGRTLAYCYPAHLLRGPDSQ